MGFAVTLSSLRKWLLLPLFKKILPNDVFHCSGKDKGPIIFMSDVADAKINVMRPAGRLFFLNILWTTVEFARFPVRFLGYRAYFTFKKFHILVYDLPDFGA